MAGAPRFNLLLLGYRNDLARWRTAEFLRRLPAAAGGPIELDPLGPLPQTLCGGIEHDAGLRLLGELRELGAHLRLVPATDDEVDLVHMVPVTETQAGSGQPKRLLALLLILLVTGFLYLELAPASLPTPPRDQPFGRPGLTGTGGRPMTGLSQHRLNNEAVELNAAGEFAAAAERLRAAMQREPDERALRRNLRTVLHNWAVAEVNAGQPEAAIGLLEEALALGEDATLLSTLGIAHVRAAEWAAGQRVLERALALGTPNPNALLALGKAYQEQSDRTGAVEMFQRAREEGAGGDAFEAALEKVERELDAEWDFAQMRSPHFQIAFEQGEDHRAARIVLRGLEEAYFVVGRKLAFFPPDPTQVVLYPSEDFHDITQAPDWTAGIYDGRIKLPVRGIEEQGELLDRTLRHEYGHVLLSLLTRGQCPFWLNEGVAIWAEEDRDGERASWALDTLAGEELFRLRSLNRPFVKLPPERVDAAYAQSYLAVRSIIDRFGAWKVRELLTALGTGRGIADAFESVLGTRLATFEGEFLQEPAG